MHPLADVRFAIRSLLQRPILTAAVAGALGMALAFNVASASVLTALLQHPFAYPELDRIVLVRDARPRDGVHQGRAISAADFLDLQRSVQAFDAVSAFRPSPMVVTSAAADPESVEAAAVTANFFTMLGVSPMLGRLWPPDADRAGHDRVVVVSRRLWQSRFGGDPSVVGREVGINGRSATLVAVIRDSDCYPPGLDVWMPLVMTPDEQRERAAQRLTGIARLSSGISIARARAEVDAFARQLAAAHPLTNEDRGFELLPLRREQYEFTAPLFGLVQAAAVLLLLLAAINATTVLVARLMDRAGELSIRSMLGASRADLSSLVMWETAILTAAAAIVGLVAAVPALDVIRASLPEGIARWVNGWSAMRVDRAAVAIAIGLAALTGFAIAGVLASSVSALVTRGASLERVTVRRTAMRRAIIATEIALAAGLLLCAFVVLQGLGRQMTTFAALAPDRLLRFTLTLPPWRYPDDPNVVAFHERALEDLAALPGVAAVALVRNEPASNVPNPVVPFHRQDAPSRSPGEWPRTDVQVVSPSAFDVLRLPILSGRGFSATDAPRAARVAVVSKDAVRRFWADRDPIGTIIDIAQDSSPARIVGVVGDLTLNWYDPEPRPVIYLVDAQSPARTTSVLLRTRIDPIVVSRQARDAIARLDRLQPIAGLEPLSASIADSLSPVRVIDRLLLAGAAAAALLAMIGVFGVLAQSVAQRLREFGVRFALGATPASIARIVLADAVVTAGVGLAAGLGVALAAVRLAQASLLGLADLNGSVVLAVVAAIFLLMLGAALVPARRASRVDVATLLRL